MEAKGDLMVIKAVYTAAATPKDRYDEACAHVLELMSRLKRHGLIESFKVREMQPTPSALNRFKISIHGAFFAARFAHRKVEPVSEMTVLVKRFASTASMSLGFRGLGETEHVVRDYFSRLASQPYSSYRSGILFGRIDDEAGSPALKEIEKILRFVSIAHKNKAQKIYAPENPEL